MTLVVAFGQRCAGDDGVGLEIADRLRARTPAIEVVTLEDPSALIELLGAGRPVVLVDAVLGDAPGAVHALGSFHALRRDTVSTHALSVEGALGIAAALHGEAVLSRISLVAIEIARAERGTIGLSPAVAAAVDAAVDAVVALAERRG